MSEAFIVGVDLAKRVFQVHGAIATGEVLSIPEQEVAEPPLLIWSAAMFRKRRTKNGKQATEARRDSFEVTAS
ncbi:hypothetical protein SAMN04488044_1911 [Cognatishimia maritima]|uniref:Transposase n=1 Tax=Cognatishimia maritima TaxID=870908 RepID=A0A1M5Q8M7_9RHOB|nr:hypothetical protein SAMN04488044_1911 [Cognatishimia maritima]